MSLSPCPPLMTNCTLKLSTKIDASFPKLLLFLAFYYINERRVNTLLQLPISTNKNELKPCRQEVGKLNFDPLQHGSKIVLHSGALPSFLPLDKI